MRAYIYIDGFNLYYAIKKSPYKWLNPKALAEQLLSKAGVTVEKIKYFTANVSGALDPDAPKRQRIYFNALETIPEVEIIKGNFISKNEWRALVHLPVSYDQMSIDGGNFVFPEGVMPIHNEVAGVTKVLSFQRGFSRLTDEEKDIFRKNSNKVEKPHPESVVARIFNMEEKGSDVNLAAHLLNDAWGNKFDLALVLTNDTDLTTPIKMVTEERGLRVLVVNPRIDKTPARKLQQAATEIVHMHKTFLKNSQFPDEIMEGIAKPESW